MPLGRRYPVLNREERNRPMKSRGLPSRRLTTRLFPHIKV
jgi:hypothetical protein